MAVDNDTLYASMSNMVRAFKRADGEPRWETGLDSAIVGGPIVSGNNLMMVTKNGSLNYLDASSGNSILGTIPLGGEVENVPAVTDKYIFVPGVDGKIFVWQGE